MTDPLDQIARICAEAPEDALSRIADVLGFKEQQAEPSIAELAQAFKYLDERVIALERAEPIINAVFECEADDLTGTAPAKVKRIEHQDDGSYTVVIDHWPQRQADKDRIIERQAQKIAELIADRDSWIEAHARLHRLYHESTHPKIGEEIHVNVSGGEPFV